MKPILLIEDNPDDAFIIQRTLKKSKKDFKLVVAKNGKEGMEKLFTEEFGCIVLDYRLPDANALDLLKTIRKDYPHIPAFILTGLKDERLMKGAMDLGAVDFLTKDEVDRLPEVIEEAIETGLSLAFREKTEEDLFENFRGRVRHLYETLFETMGEGLFALDTDGVLVLVNRRLARMLGREKSDLLGQSTSILMEGKGLKIFQREYAKVKSGQARHFETIFITKTDIEIPVLINHTPLFDENGIFDGSLSLVADIAELKKMESRLRETEKLTIIAQIASEAAHEIRNPLSVIKAGLYYLKGILPQEEKVEKRILQLDGAIERVSSYLDDLLNLAGPPTLSLSQISINDLIGQSLKELPSDLLSNIGLQKELDKKLPKTKVDPDRMKQVFINIIKNAAEVMKEKGKLKVRSEKLEVKGKEVIQISFEDTGPGISEENMEKIFDPFFTTKVKGTGLGLPICGRFIEAHGGEIEAESKFGHGSKFIIRLPLWQQKGVGMS